MHEFQIKNGFIAHSGSTINGTLLVTSGITGNTFSIPNGNSSQFLKADGSIDDTIYMTQAELSTGFTEISLFDSHTGNTSLHLTTNQNTLLDGISGVTFTEINYLSGMTGNTQQQLNTEVLNRTSADTTLNNLITGETANRISADAVLNNSITGLTSIVTTNYNLLTGETENRISQDLILNNLITGETFNRITGDTRLNNLITGLTDTVTTNYNLLTGETANRISQDVILNNLITGETANRVSADITLNNSITGLTSNFISHTGDTSLHLTSSQNTLLDGISGVTFTEINYLSGMTGNAQQQLNTEVLNRTTGYTSLNNLITGETATRISQDVILNNLITGETATRISQDGILNNSITGLSATVTNNYNLLTGETSARIAQDIVLNNLITGETANRISQDGILNNSITGLTSNFNTHTGDTSLHLTSSQNTLLDGISGVTFTEINYLSGMTGNTQNQLNNEVLNRITGYTSLNNLITGETANRISADTILNNTITGLSATVTTNYNLLTGETANRISQDTILNNLITGETVNRISADTALNNSITGLSANVSNNYIPYTGATSNVNLGSHTIALDAIKLNTGTTYVVSNPGEIGWNVSDGTFDMGLLNGSVLQAGQELHVYGKAQGNINNRDVVQFAGVQGNHILLKVAIPAEIAINPHLLIGIATDNILNNNFGYITTFGKVNDVFTTGFNLGDILYFDSVNGGLTKTQPQAPNRNIEMAAVIKLATGVSENGIIMVRLTFGSLLTELEDVNGTPLSTTGQILVWDNTRKVHDFTANINNYLPLSGGTITGSLIKSGGTSTQFLMADGSISTTGDTLAVYDNRYVNITGDTMTGNLNVNGNVNIYGNIIQSGSTYETHAQQVFTSGDTIILRDGAISGLGVGAYTGLVAKKYDGVNDGRLVFDNTGLARVGDIGFEQALATREENPTHNYLTFWNSGTTRLETINPINLPISTLTNNAITGETATRINQDIVLNNLITGETANRISQDNTLNNLITGETANRITANTTLTNNFISHTGDTSLHLTSSQNTLLDGISGVTFTEINYLSGMTGNTQQQLNTEVLNRTTGYTSLNNSITGLSATVTNNYNLLTGETVTRLAQDNLLNNLITGETANRISADTILNNSITGLSATVTTNYNLLTGETANRISADLTKVTANATITGATKTKITYDSKGLVTSGADATTADIAASTNKNYVTDAQLVVIGNTSNTNSGDNAVNSLYSGLVSNATHTGDATGSTALRVIGINNVIMSSLGTGLVKNTTGTGVPSIASAGSDFIAPGSIIGDGLTMNTGKILGRTTAATGSIEEISIGSGLSLSGGVMTTTGSTTAFTVQDEGSTLSSTVNTLNFVGAGVTVAGASNVSTITIPTVTPGDGDKSIQFNDGGSFGGSSNFTYDKTTNIATLGGTNTGLVINAITAEQGASSAGTLRLYSKSIASRIVPKIVGPAGVDTPIQNAIWQNNVTLWTPTTATSGLWIGTVGAGAGTYTTQLPTTTSLYTTMKRARYANIATTTNQVLGQRNTELMYFAGSAAGQGGFFFTTRMGFDTWTNGGRFFAGMHTATTVISANPSSLNNTVGFCVDSTDNGLIYFLTRNASTATKASTGFTIVSGKGYDLFIFVAPGSSSYGWRIVDINSGTESSGIATLTTPVANTMLSVGVLASNAALTSVTSINLGINKIYVETDL